jgi:hypothetical protein
MAEDVLLVHPRVKSLNPAEMAHKTTGQYTKEWKLFEKKEQKYSFGSFQVKKSR